jgi:hypothetical protein
MLSLTPGQIDQRLAELLGECPPLIEAGVETWAEGVSDAQSGLQSQSDADCHSAEPAAETS